MKTDPKGDGNSSDWLVRGLYRNRSCVAVICLPSRLTVMTGYPICSVQVSIISFTLSEFCSLTYRRQTQSKDLRVQTSDRPAHDESSCGPPCPIKKATVLHLFCYGESCISIYMRVCVIHH